MAAEVKIKATADTSEAKRKLEDLGRSADTSLDKASRSADKLGKSLDNVGKSAGMSANAIKQMAVGFSGLAIGVAGTALRANGKNEAADYLGGTARGATQGAAMGAPLGPWGMAAGAVIGGVAGAAQTYFEKEAAEKKEAEARKESIASMNEALDAYAKTSARTEAFAALLGRLGDTAGDASARQESLAAAIAERTKKDADLEEKMRAAANRNDTEQFGELAKERAANASELSRLKSVKIELPKAEKVDVAYQAWNEHDRRSTNLERIGASLGGSVSMSAERMQQKQIDLAKESRDLLSRIAQNSQTATFA